MAENGHCVDYPLAGGVVLVVVGARKASGGPSPWAIGCHPMDSKIKTIINVA
jgi:hypothetical protein